MNATDTRQVYQIRRIRLVNFHNFQNETIDIESGGHLFLLGDNGSGKTTVLDAVQYVLTGGNHMEFNSAARVAGARNEGRRVQGIVMRYNVDTGPINAAGGVSYAGLELADDTGSVLTLGVGISAYSMEERVQRWGIITDEPLESVPWLITDQSGTRVTPQKEMREHLLARGAFFSMGAYEKEVARRLFDTEETFVEMCRFLSMGKAYRELAASAADYHELFKSLLPEPKTDLFDRIVEALKSLDEAGALLDDMRRKLEYLESLTKMVSDVSELRESVARYGWLLLHMEQQEIQSTIDDIRSRRHDLKLLLEKTAAEADAAVEQKVALSRQLDDMRSRDGAGLVRQERELATDRQRRATQAAEVELAAGECQRAFDRADTLCEAAATRLRECVLNVASLLSGSGIPPVFETIRTADVHKLADADTVQGLRDEAQGSIDRAIGTAQDEINRKAVELDRLQVRIDEQSERKTALAAELERLRAEGEMRPDIPGLQEALKALDDNGIPAKPLYELLEWEKTTDDATRAWIEECIGDDVLCTLAIDEEDWGRGRQVVLSSCPSVRIAPRRVLPGTLPDWIRNAFSLVRSNPIALQLLAHEMVARRGPEVEKLEGGQALLFRAHDRRLSGRPSRWIGQEERKRALECRIAELVAGMEENERELTRLESEARKVRESSKQLTIFRDNLTERSRAFMSALDRNAAAVREREFRDEALRSVTRRLEETRGEIRYLDDRIEALREIIRREGLEDLEQRMRELQRHIDAADQQHRMLLVENGKLQSHDETLQEQAAAHSRRGEALVAELRDAEEKVRRLACQKIDDVSYYVLRTRQGLQFKSAESIQAAIQDSLRRESLTAGMLTERINDPLHGAVYGFHYDQTGNTLRDRRDLPVAEIAQAQATAIAEQQEIINQKTNELFTRIIVNEMVTFFATHLSRLDRMVQTINHHLGHRSFGSTRYRLELQKVERYKPFIDAVKKFNPFDSRADEVFRQFIEDHREEIVSSSVDSIPEVLDYRNWYTYHLRMFTANDDGVIMDRRTKSVGSGGEQAVPNYLTILTIAHFMFIGSRVRLHALLFDEAFYGIDAGRRDQVLGFAGDLGLQLLVASPEQDGVRREVRQSTTLLVVKDTSHDVHLYPFHWDNQTERQMTLFEEPAGDPEDSVEFGPEIVAEGLADGSEERGR